MVDIKKASIRTIVFTILVSLCLGLSFSLQIQPQHAEDSTTVKKILKHAKFLASDALRGRDTFSQGQYKAARYIAWQFKKFGLKPVTASNNYYQSFKMDFTEVLSPSTFEISGKPYLEGHDFRVADEK